MLDASATVPWLVDDEAPSSARPLFDRVVAQGAVVPALWRLEVANAVLMAERRGRITAKQRTERLDELRKLTIEVDDETVERAWSSILELAAQHRLTLYDAAYLELALRRRLPLATLDRELARAGQAAGVTLLPD